MLSRHVQFCAAALLVLLPSVASAQVQPAQTPPPAYISMVDGVVTLERDGEIQPAVQNMPLVVGDRLRTANGRVQIQFPDGSAVELGEDSEIEIVTATRVRLLAGTLDRLESATAPAQSAPYLPQDLQMYGSTFDQYGSWQYDSPYGYVWYPRVASTWRPYYYGYWDTVGPYGWTWIGTDVWSWPTHHYGRWGYSRGSWFWIPGRSFAPAWVSWGTATDYVSWCPLGYDNRPVFALATGYGRGWNGWTVLSRSHFGSRGYYANRYAIPPHHISAHTVFASQTTPPAAPHVRRGATVPAAAAGIAVPRYGAPDGFRRSNGDRATTDDERPSTSDRRRGTSDYRTGVAVPRATMPPPVVVPQTTMPQQPAPPQVTPYNTPQVERGYRYTPPGMTVPQRDAQPQRAQPRDGGAATQGGVRSHGGASRPPAAAAPAQSAPAQSAPQQRAEPQRRSAPAAAVPAGTAVPRGEAQGRGQGSRRRQ